jgi:hypothetical protein
LATKAALEADKHGDGPSNYPGASLRQDGTTIALGGAGVKVITRQSTRAVLVAAAMALFFSSKADAATIFNFSFDNTSGGGVTPPLVGSGVFSVDDNLGPGSYPLSTLTNVAFNASFTHGPSFTLADLEDPLADVLAVITAVGPNLFMRFGNVNGNSGGTINGAADFVKPGPTSLSFQPGVSGGELYFVTGLSGTGSYEAIQIAAVPEPASLVLLGTGLLYAGARRRRTRAAVNNQAE